MGKKKKRKGKGGKKSGAKNRKDIVKQQDIKEHAFWDKEPVLLHSDALVEPGPIQFPADIEVSEQPFPLPGAFEWVNLDLTDREDLDALFDLLAANYGEGDDGFLRQIWSREFLQWALCVPGYFQDWHLGVRVKSNGRLVATLFGIPVNTKIEEESVRCVQCNFLCVHKKLRNKRLTPMLFRELTRRIQLRDYWHAFATATPVFTKPFSRCYYYNRILNPEKISHMVSNQEESTSNSNAHKQARLDSLNQIDFTIQGIRPMKESDVPGVHALMSEHLSKYRFAPIWTEDEVAHFLIPRENIVQTWVVEDPENGEISDLFSYYCLDSNIMPRKTLVHHAYVYYCIAGKHSKQKLIKNLLICTRIQDKDIVTSLNFQDLESHLEKCKFRKGRNPLFYYLYNYRTNLVEPHQMGMVLF